jgi:hypothetical protein
MSNKDPWILTLTLRQLIMKHIKPIIFVACILIFSTSTASEKPTDQILPEVTPLSGAAIDDDQKTDDDQSVIEYLYCRLIRKC